MRKEHSFLVYIYFFYLMFEKGLKCLEEICTFLEKEEFKDP